MNKIWSGKSGIALTVLLLIARPISAQSKPMPHLPKLPVITRDVLPGEGWALGRWIIRSMTPIYDTWQKRRKVIARLPPQTRVTALAGLNIVDEPDEVIVTTPIPTLRLVPRDKMFRYIYQGEGTADFWVKGRWYKNLDGSFIIESDGSGCGTNCAAKVTKQGRKTWWFQIRTDAGGTGWTNAIDNLDPAP